MKVNRERIVNAFKKVWELRPKLSHETILSLSSLLIIFILALSVRLLPLRWGMSLSEFDPFEQFRFTEKIVNEGYFSWLDWRDFQRWYPWGAYIPRTNLPGLPLTAATFYMIISALGVSVTLKDFCIVFPAIMGAIACVVIYFLGKEISGKELLKKFDALCLTIGAMHPRDLSIDGRELDGIHFAMDYLTQQNKVNDGAYVAYDNRITAENRHVLVIGGGDTGSDCVGTATRQGAKSVTQIEILPKPPEQRSADNPWPYYAKTLKTSTSHEEGCERRWSLSTLRFLGMQQRVTHAEVQEVAWEQVNGNHKMHVVPGSTEKIDADLILLAMGFVHPVHEGLLTEMEIGLDSRRNIQVNPEMLTNQEKVFAAGDAASGASLVVTAIASGRRVARKIDDFLSSDT